MRGKKRTVAVVVAVALTVGLALQMTPAGAITKQEVKQVLKKVFKKGDKRYVNVGEVESVDGPMIVNGAVTTDDILSNTINAGDVEANSLGTASINEDSLESPLVRDIVYVSETSASDADPEKDVTASCPVSFVNHKVIGGGGVAREPGLFGSTQPELTINLSAPTGANDGWRVIASNSGAFAGDWIVTAYAICARI